MIRPHQHIFTLLLLCFLVYPQTAMADGYLDKIKSAYKDTELKIRDKYKEHQQKKQKEEELELAQETTPPTLPTDLPTHWQLNFDQEPIFQSYILIAETGDKTKPLVIFIHGLGQAGLRDWLPVIPALEQHYHIVTLDLPGFGHSATPEGRYSPTNYAKVINWVQQRYGKEKAHVIGHSMGGAIALRYASMFPEQVDFLVLVDAAGILTRAAFLKQNAGITTDVSDTTNELQNLTAGLKDIGGSLIELTDRLPDPTAYLQKYPGSWNKLVAKSPNANAAIALIDENFSSAVFQLPHPTQLIWGEKDPIAPLRTGRLLAEHLPRSRLITLPEAGHVPMKSHTEEFNRILLAALKQAPTLAPKEEAGNTSPDVQQGELTCYNETGKTYQGSYDTITISHCSGIILKNVHTKRLKIEESVVNLIDSQITSEGTALEATESVIHATNLTINANIGIAADGSRFDLAGISIRGREAAMTIDTTSHIIFSIGKISSSEYAGYVHGTYRLKKTTLDETLEQANGKAP